MPVYSNLPEFRFKSTTLVDTVCPFCGALHNAHSNVTNVFPVTDGAVSLCVRCGNLAFFDHKALGRLRKPTDDEQKEFDESPQVQKELALWRQWRDGKNV